jgi:hypothetical protein
MAKKEKNGFPKEFESIDKQQADLIFDRIKKGLGPVIAALFDQYGLDGQRLIRFMPVAARCREAREDKGLSIKQAAAKLKVPQYRLKAIEDQGSAAGIQPDILERYIDFLDLREWFTRWVKKNQDVYDRMKEEA